MDRSRARVAGIVCLALGLLSVAASLGALVFGDRLPPGLNHPVGMGLDLVLAVLWSVAAMHLIRGRIWAHQLLLVLNLLGLVLGVIALLLWLILLGKGAQMTIPAAPPAWLLGLLGGSMAVAVAVQWLLIRCSALRLRYASIVGTSVAAAVVLAIILNVFAQTDYLRKDIETQGRYGLSERTKKILESTTQPVRLTCLYTSSDEKTRGSEFAPPVMDLLNEMHEKNNRIEVVNASSDADKAAVLTRLKSAAATQAKKHIDLLTQFKTRAPGLINSIQNEKRLWADLPADSYLNLWGLGAEVARLLDSLSQEFEKGKGSIDRELSGSTLPDYAKLVASLTETLKTAATGLAAPSALLEKFTAIPPAIARNRTNILEQADKASQAVEALAKALDAAAATGSGATADLAAKATAAAAEASRRLKDLSRAVFEAAGTDPDVADLVRSSQPMIFGNMPLDAFYAAMAKMADDVQLFCQSIGRSMKPDLQPQAFASVKSQVGKRLPLSLLQEARAALAAGLDRLAKIDKPTADLLGGSEGGKFLSALRTEIEALSKQAAALPALKPDTLSADLAKDNAVLIETADKAQVVPFGEVWPQKVQRQGPEESSQDKRVFNGDAAISSKILAMTHKPFATVVLASLELPPQLASRLPRSLSSQNCSALRKRLTDANFVVKDWNLAEEMPPADEAAKVRILLVLPPVPIPATAAGQIPSFGPEHMAKIRQAIDTQAVDGAIFFTSFSPSNMMLMPTFNLIADYLADQWGIQVKNDSFVLYGLPDENAPDRFSVSLQRLRFMPLTGLGDHPISKPLRSQRLIGANTCPILIADPLPGGVRVEPLVSVPPTKEIWATTKLQELIDQFQGAEGSLIRPDYAAGDMRAPFPLAVAATRTPDKAKGVKDARVVVMSLAEALADGYLDQPMMELTAKGGIVLTDPPQANADLVANSVYWLSGNNDYIAAGPAAVQPLQAIEPPVLSAIKMIYLLGLPLATLAIGAAVMALRKRT